MKAGRTLTELAAEVERQIELKKDYLAPSGKVRMEITTAALVKGAPKVRVPSLVLANGNGGIDLGIRRSAHGQIASRLGIPKRYYDRMLAEQPELLADNVNTWFESPKDERRFLLRTMDGEARALLSDRYRPLDNDALLENILPVLLHEMRDAGVADSEQLRVESCQITDSKLYLKVVTPRLTAEIKKGDVVQAGLVLSNSEVGQGSLNVQPLLYRLVCLNGMIANDWAMRRSHVGRKNAIGDLSLAEEFFTDETRAADDRALWLKVRDTVRGFFDPVKFTKTVERLRASTEEKLNHDKAEEVVEVTAKRFGFGETTRRSVLRHLLTDGDMTRYGLMNAVTRASQDVTDYDEATRMERVGGQIIELPKKDWSAIAQLN